MIHCKPSCYILGAAMILLLPLDWLLSAMTAALVHEGCHMLSVLLFGGRIRSVRIGARGCVIECGELEGIAGILSILAGPAGSLSLLFLRRSLPKIAVCGLIQGLYNLMPVLPLDGGRILRILLNRWIPDKADFILKGIRYSLFLGLALWGLWLSWLRYENFLAL